MTFIKRHIFHIIGFVLLAVVFEIMGRTVSFSLFVGAIVMCYLFFRIRRYWLRMFCLLVSVFALVLALLMTRSIWLVWAIVIMVWWLFKSVNGNELVTFGESLLHPYRRSKHYIGVKLVRPQSGQRALLKRQSLMSAMAQHANQYEWDDINIVIVGGDSIIDCGNTILPDGESIVIIRKLFGRTRLIIPRNIGLKLNVSALSATVVFENQQYPLTSENFHWLTPDYQATPRRLRVIISIVFGEVEVILV